MNTYTTRQLYLPLVAALAVSLLCAGSAFAQEEVGTIEQREAMRAELNAEREERRAEIESTIEAERENISAQRDATRTEIAAEREERRAELSERSAERITNLAANVSNKMDAAAARIQDIITRLESRIDKLEEVGLDVTEAEAALASAQISLNTAVNNLATIDVTVQTAVTSENPRESFTEVRTAYQSIKEQLRTAHTEIKAAVQALKDSAKEMEDSRGASAAVRNPASSISENTDSTEDEEGEESEGEVTSETEVNTSAE